MRAATGGSGAGPGWRHEPCRVGLDQFSFQGPFAYRWVDDIPVERIDLRSGERHAIEIGNCCLLPAPLPAGESAAESPLQRVRAAMAAWN